jgi:cytochrome c-type biogenesis protein CcmH
MSFTLLGWSLIIASIAIATALFLSPQMSSRSTALPRLRLSSLGFGQEKQSTAATFIAPAVVFLLIAGMGTATSYFVVPSAATDTGEASAGPHSQSGEDGELLALSDYARSIGAGDPAARPAEGKMLPDVNTMIEQLAARLEASPGDVQGWRMLGWSYFNTEHYEQAAAAYAKAMELDPNAADLKTAYEEAKAKASGGEKSAAASPPQGATVPQSVTAGAGPHGASAEKAITSETKAPHMGEEQVRSMVEGLAARLENSPRDAEGWARLMRSRVVLGEKEVAATAYRKALEVFKDDSAASAQITAEATALGLKAE